MEDTTTVSPWKALESYVGRRVTRIQKAYLDPRRSEGGAWLAELRKAGDAPGSSPVTWALEFEGFPEDLIGRTDQPSPGERAAHLAFKLYAIHQQSQSLPMHQHGKEHGLGAAVFRLQARQSESVLQGKLPSRFAALGTASTFEETSHYARQLVTQLRGESIPLDYGRLASQLYLLQSPATADSVRLEWGRGFAGTSNNSTSDEKEK